MYTLKKPAEMIRVLINIHPNFFSMRIM